MRCRWSFKKRPPTKLITVYVVKRIGETNSSCPRTRVRKKKPLFIDVHQSSLFWFWNRRYFERILFAGEWENVVFGHIFLLLQMELNKYMKLCIFLDLSCKLVQTISKHNADHPRVYGYLNNHLTRKPRALFPLAISTYIWYLTTFYQMYVYIYKSWLLEWNSTLPMIPDGLLTVDTRMLFGLNIIKRSSEMSV